MSMYIVRINLDRENTFPFKVVAANSLASGGVDESCSMLCVVFHASDCPSVSAWLADRWSRWPYRFLKFLKEFVSLGLVLASNITLHGSKSRQYMREAPLARSIGSHDVTAKEHGNGKMEG